MTSDREQDALIITRLAQRLSFTDIGSELGMSRDAVRRRVARIVADLKHGAAADPTHAEVLRLQGEIEEQKATLSLAKRQLKALHKNESVFKRLADVIAETTAPLAPAEPVKIEWPKGKRSQVDMVLVLADEHADQIVTAEQTNGLETYNFNVFRARLEKLRDLLVEYVTVHLPAHEFGRLYILKLGDAVNGDIHELGPKNQFANTMKAALAVGDAEAHFIQSVEPYFKQGVAVIGVSGNHPRRTKLKDYDSPHDNYDYLVGTQIATRLAGLIDEKRVSVILPESYTAYVEIKGKVWALNHGDDVASAGGLPWVSFDKRNARVQYMTGIKRERVDYFVYGHYHTPAEFASAGGKSIHSGAWTLVDTFAFNKLMLGGNEPQQTLYVVKEHHGIILPIPIYTRDVEREELMAVGAWLPELGDDLVLDQVKPVGYVGDGLHVIRLDE